MKKKEKLNNAFSCLLSILDSIKLHDKGVLYEKDETLSQIMFRKMQGYKIDLNKELGFDHLKPVSVEERDENYRISEAENSISLLNWVKSEGYSTEISKNGEIFWKNQSKKIKMIDSSDLYDRYINR